MVNYEWKDDLFMEWMRMHGLNEDARNGRGCTE